VIETNAPVNLSELDTDKLVVALSLPAARTLVALFAAPLPGHLSLALRDVRKQARALKQLLPAPAAPKEPSADA
jgi:hypothetical protein